MENISFPGGFLLAFTILGWISFGTSALLAPLNIQSLVFVDDLRFLLFVTAVCFYNVVLGPYIDHLLQNVPFPSLWHLFDLRTYQDGYLSAEIAKKQVQLDSILMEVKRKKVELAAHPFHFDLHTLENWDFKAMAETHEIYLEYARQEVRWHKLQITIDLSIQIFLDQYADIIQTLKTDIKKLEVYLAYNRTQMAGIAQLRVELIQIHVRA
ncbi:MAG: hypothetical protein Q9169_005858 [Polycauliona sp. 2 TL-2023]